MGLPSCAAAAAAAASAAAAAVAAAAVQLVGTLQRAYATFAKADGAAAALTSFESAGA